MTQILAAVLLSLLLGPGMGQLYNREYRKAVILISLSVLFLFFFSLWLGRAAASYLPTDLATIDSATLRPLLRNIIEEHVVREHTGTFYTYEALLGCLWLYGVVDAYLGAVRRRAQGAPSTPRNH